MATEITGKEAVALLLGQAKEGRPLLFGSMPDADGKDDAYTIQCVGHYQGSTLKVDTPVDHIGLGCFRAMVGGRKVMFDGGGAMYRIYDVDKAGNDFRLSYTYLDATPEQLVAMGYDNERTVRYLTGCLARFD